MRSFFCVFAIIFLCNSVLCAENDTVQFYSLEANFHSGYIVENAKDLPKSINPYLWEFNPSVQTNGSKEWHHIFGLPKIGCAVFFGNLGNNHALGNMFGLLPNMTFNTIRTKWYSPKISLGLGLAYFNKPYNAKTDTLNFYIGSHITAFAHASLYVQPRLSDHFSLTLGMAVSHCSNGHYQVPNLGMNLISVFAGIVYHPVVFPKHFERRKIQAPAGKIKFNIRAGMGVHEFARTMGPIGTPKYAIYTTDIYLSRFYGRMSNVHAGLEVNHYNSYYNYIVNNAFFTNQQKLRASVLIAYLADELIIHHISILFQGGINVYNQFYDNYMKMYRSERGLKSELGKYIGTRLGVQYYLFDPKYCSQTNVYLGVYIKAHFGQADFTCIQVGYVF